jgi:hypothetical protein
MSEVGTLDHTRKERKVHSDTRTYEEGTPDNKEGTIAYDEGAMNQHGETARTTSARKE